MGCAVNNEHQGTGVLRKRKQRHARWFGTQAACTLQDAMEVYSACACRMEPTTFDQACAKKQQNRYVLQFCLPSTLHTQSSQQQRSATASKTC
jgi:hypothetical protein